jgi:hypothetical protein
MPNIRPSASARPVPNAGAATYRHGNHRNWLGGRLPNPPRFLCTECLFVAHRVVLLSRNNSVAFGAKRTLSRACLAVLQRPTHEHRTITNAAAATQQLELPAIFMVLLL